MNKNSLVCVLGVYGKGNLGDEALLLAIQDEILSINPNTHVVAFCSDPCVVKNELNIEAQSRKPFPNFFRKINLIRRANVLILGGGTMLYDHQKWKQELAANAAFVFWPIVAKLFRTPVIAVGQGLGPANHFLTKFTIRYVYSRFDAITLRDNKSYNLLELISTELRAVKVACDPVIAVDRFNPKNIISKTSENNFFP